jgi:hypothetical protein
VSAAARVQSGPCILGQGDNARCGRRLGDYEWCYLSGEHADTVTRLGGEKACAACVAAYWAEARKGMN